MNLLMIDNYDSFTYNLVHRFGELGARCEVVRNDAEPVEKLLARQVDALVISPGPCSPLEAGLSLDLVKHWPAEKPLLGVCLGHQTIAMAFGGKLQQDSPPVHGKVVDIHHDGSGLFANIDQSVAVTRYHSLSVVEDNLPAELVVNARQDGLIMGLRHQDRPWHGVQFHPESIKCPAGFKILGNFLKLCGAKR